MTHFIKTIAATAIFAASASTAFAGTTDTFAAKFKYDANANAEETYAGFKKTVTSVCRKQAMDAGFSSRDIRSTTTAPCERQLLENAVNKTNNVNIISIHEAETLR